MIKTERLFVRRVCSEDWRAYQSIWTAVGQTEYAQYDCKHDTDDDIVRSKIEKWTTLRDSIAHMFFSVCLESTVIGYIAAHRNEESYEIGYCFHPNYHGKGYAKESIAAVINEIRKTGIKRITAGTAIKNISSVKLLKSLGFTQIGTEKVSFHKDENGKDIVFDGGIFELK